MPSMMVMVGLLNEEADENDLLREELFEKNHEIEELTEYSQRKTSENKELKKSTNNYHDKMKFS